MMEVSGGLMVVWGERGGVGLSVDVWDLDGRK